MWSRFGERHKHVIRDIDALLPRLGEQAFFTEITLHTIDEEPRVLDTDLAERLGYAAPHDQEADQSEHH